MSLLVTIVLPLVEKSPPAADVKPGWLGFVMFLALAAATFLLWLSFRRQLKKVDFEEKEPTTDGKAESGPAPQSEG